MDAPMEKPKKPLKKKKPPDVKYLRHMFDRTKSDFEREFENLQYIMKNGGIGNIHIGECLRRLKWQYDLICAQAVALGMLNGWESPE